jgi:N-acetylmuramoyl-L-alanine amidase
MKTVLLSAGHYPAAPGACSGEVCEHPLAIEWCDRVFLELVNSGVRCIPVLPGPLKDKVRFINRHQADLCVEIHFNACGGCSARGSETLYMPGSLNGFKAANEIQKYLADVFPPSRGVKEGWYRMDRPGIKDYAGDVDGDEQPDYFLRKTRWPAVIVEPEFIHNTKEVIQKRDEGCHALARGIIAALNT